MTKDNSSIIFQKFTEKYIQKYLSLYPGVGSNLGLHQFDGQVKDSSRTGIEKQLFELKNFYTRLTSEINYDVLSDDEKFDYEIAQWSIESAVFDLEELQEDRRDPLYYAFIFGELHNYISREYAPFDQRLRSLINIIDKIPETLKNAEINLNKSLPDILCKYAKQFSKGYKDFLERDLLEEIKLRSTDKILISEYMTISQSAVEAFQKFIHFLDGAGNTEDNSFRLGKNTFEKMLKVKEQIDLPIDEIKRLGFAELEWLQKEMQRVLKENDFKDKLGSLEHTHPSEKDLVKETGDLLNELIEFIRQNEIVNLPEKLNCMVTAMPRYINFGFAAMNTAGPFENSDESFYYVNLPEQGWDETKKEEWMTQFNYPTLKLISIHEAYPGHYTHFLNANRNKSKLSKLFMSYSYTEGWAHYTEEMMIEQGYGKDDFKIKIGQLLEALVRCCRYIVAIGIHCENMSIEEAKNFFLKHAYMNETTATQEAERGAFDPGYINYTLGKILLKQFKKKYFDKFNGLKTLKEFHDTIVSFGAPTFKIAERYIIS